MPTPNTLELSSEPVIPDIEADIASRALAYKVQTGYQPGLLVISADPTHDGSQRYMKGKKNVGGQLGIDVHIEEVATADEIFGLIQTANCSPLINGTIVQLPLSEDLNPLKDEILAAVAPAKDVDGLGPETHALPATAKAIDILLDHYDLKSEGLIALLGLGALANGPLLNILRDQEAVEVEGFDLSSDRWSVVSGLDRAAVIVSATGDPGILTPDLFVPGTTPKSIIDVGTAGTAKQRDQSQQGDISEALREFATTHPEWRLTPQVGGVGKLTIRALMSNVMDAAEQQAGITPIDTEVQRRHRVAVCTHVMQPGSYPSQPPAIEDDRPINPFYNGAAYEEAVS